MIKLYYVTFMEYVNDKGETKDDVRRDRYGTTDYTNYIRRASKPLTHVRMNTDPMSLLYVGTDRYIIREDEIPIYSKFGGGIRYLEFVGYYREQSGCDEIKRTPEELK